MCGIYLTNFDLDEIQLKEKIQTIKFRGPDYTGYKKVNELSFGHLRLSIIDVEERSNQPMVHDNYTIVFNGEIYNYKDIRADLLKLGYDFNTESDTEVILKGYAEWGKDVVLKLNGMFAFAIYNSTTNTIFCSRDRLGVKPFYYYWNEGQIEICSQLRPIVYDKKLELDSESISLYLEFGYIPSPVTIYKNVYKLESGHNLYIDLNSNKIFISKYWDLEKIKISQLSFAEARDQVHNLLKDAIKIRLNSDVPIGCFLSGGIDSSLVASIAQQMSEKPINTFSIGFEDPKYDESKIAAKYSKIIGSNHTEIICTPNDVLRMLPDFIKAYDEPFADSSALPSLLLNKKTKKYVTVALSGDGGDESFIGYNHFDALTKYVKLNKIPYIIRYLLSFAFVNKKGLLKHSFKLSFRVKTISDYIIRIIAGQDTILKDRDMTFSFVKKYYGSALGLSDNYIQKLADFSIKLWLENDSNVKVDRASMAFSMEVRSPFLDYRLVEYARTLPMNYRFNSGRKKIILRDILKEYIPEDVFNQPKKGFEIPLENWIRNELKEEISSALSDDFLLKVPNLNIPKFKKILTRHMNGEEDYTTTIWKLYVLSKWYEEFGYNSSR